MLSPTLDAGDGLGRERRLIRYTYRYTNSKLDKPAAIDLSITSLLTFPRWVWFQVLQLGRCNDPLCSELGWKWCVPTVVETFGAWVGTAGQFLCTTCHADPFMAG